MTFEELAAAHRRELHLHCYRIVGSVQDAEDLVQETLLAAWRGLDGFEERSSMRTWLYRIATNRCLNALRDRGRRPAVAGPPPPEPTRRIEPVWLEPYPDPEARYEAREAIGLAYITALQRLPPRQRAVLVLRDVLGFRGAEVADMLGLSEAAVASALHRARSAVPPERESVPAEPGLIDAFVDAFESGDVDRVVALLSSDARLTMPPEPLEYEGPEAIGRFLGTVPAGGQIEQIRLVPTRANGQPAFGCYLRDPAAPVAHAYGLMVLTVDGARITAITGFIDTAVFAAFGLPRTIAT